MTQHARARERIRQLGACSSVSTTETHCRLRDLEGGAYDIVGWYDDLEDSSSRPARCARTSASRADESRNIPSHRSITRPQVRGRTHAVERRFETFRSGRQRSCGGVQRRIGEQGMTEQLVHQAFLYERESDYICVLSKFALEGVDGGERVLIAVPGENLTRLQHGMGDRAEEITFADMSRIGRNPARIIPIITEFLSRGSRERVRFVNEPIWPGRSAAEIAEGIRHEALLNVAFADAQATIVCPYDTAGLDAGVIADAAHTHPEIVSCGSSPPSEAYREPLDVYDAHDRPLPPPGAPVETLVFCTDLRSLREWVTALAGEASLDRHRTSDLVLAANEAVSNTLVHSDGNATVRIWRTDEELVCEVSDKGHISDPLVGRRAPAAGEVGGRGLWLINHLCDLVELRSGQDGGTVLRLHVTIG